MTRRWVAVLAWVVAAAGGVWAGVRLGTRTAAREGSAMVVVPGSVVQVRALWSATEGAAGTGVVLTDGTILTAEHVVKVGSVIEVVFGGRDGRPEERATLTYGQAGVQVVRERDAVVMTGFKVPAWVRGEELSGRAAREGEVVTSFGLVAADGVRVRVGKVVLAEVPGRPDLMHTRVRTESGDSGGPVFDAAGRVVGIVQGHAWWDEPQEVAGAGGKGRVVYWQSETDRREAGVVTKLSPAVVGKRWRTSVRGGTTEPVGGA